ncbi:hypothetical protein pb186bvf_019968 [Paramecium bursaria]
MGIQVNHMQSIKIQILEILLALGFTVLHFRIHKLEENIRNCIP